eukprot:jgi/Ulvmu1/9049/UM005_0142.1
MQVAQLRSAMATLHKRVFPNSYGCTAVRANRLQPCIRNTIAFGKRGLQALQELDADRNAEQVPIANTLEWKSPLTLNDMVKYPDPRLRAPNATIKVFGERLQELADELFDVMYKDDGVGLAAPQVGLNLRLMVFNPAGERGKGKELILANPRIISSTGLESDEEGCLSFKYGREMILGDVERATSIKIKAQNVLGKTQRLTFDGFTARIFQHEFDHLQGTLFPDRMQLDHLERERKKLEKMEADFRRQNPSAEIQSCLARLA